LIYKKNKVDLGDLVKTHDPDIEPGLKTLNNFGQHVACPYLWEVLLSWPCSPIAPFWS
jgi:hypothetical protein